MARLCDDGGSTFESLGTNVQEKHLHLLSSNISSATQHTHQRLIVLSVCYSGALKLTYSASG